MADKNSVNDWSETASTNDNVGGVPLGENVMLPSNVNNAFRVVMAQLRAFFKSSVFRLRDGTDQTKVLALDLTAIPTATTRTLKVPASGQFVGTDAQTFTETEKGQARANIDAGVMGGFRNKVYNGGFVIAQNGTSFVIPAGSAAYTADGWLVNNTTNQTATITVNDRNTGYSEALVPGASQGYLNVAFSVAPTSGQVYLLHRIEGVETLAGQVATLTMYCNASVANSDTIGWFAVQFFGTGGSPNGNVVTAGTLNIGTIYNAGTRKRTGTVSIPSVAGKVFGSNKNDCLELSIMLAPRTATSYQIDRVSLVEGDATAEADPFAPRPTAVELALCQRYFQTYEGVINANGNIAGYVGFRHMLPVQMRASPTGTVTDTSGSVNASTIAFTSNPRSVEIACIPVSGGWVKLQVFGTLDARL